MNRDNETLHVGRRGFVLFTAGPLTALPVVALGTEIALFAASLMVFISWLLAIVCGYIGREHISGKIALVGPFVLSFVLWTSVPHELPDDPDEEPVAAAQADP